MPLVTRNLILLHYHAATERWRSLTDHKPEVFFSVNPDVDSALTEFKSCGLDHKPAQHSAASGYDAKDAVHDGNRSTNTLICDEQRGMINTYTYVCLYIYISLSLSLSLYIYIYIYISIYIVTLRLGSKAELAFSCLTITEAEPREHR
uniref:Uncharacterized protein n=1 Tax=Physcomitrium patens TaxID=3218 RepID=A0A2K1IUU1_PHYPA|nr:hypothetical protein PHYPA_024988 [Physcomitrium patens]